jgi:hypothetical protein
MAMLCRKDRSMRLALSLTAVLAASCFAVSAAAQEPEPAPAAPAGAPPAPATEETRAEETPKAHGGLLAGAKVGGLLSFGGLNPNARVGVELGYVFPWLNRSFAFLVDADYAAPKSSGTQAGDPRVQGGTYDWHLTEQILAIQPTIMYRFTKLKSVVPFIGVGPRIYMLRSTVRGAVGSVEIPETTEQSTKVGLGVPFGAEIKLGPGALIGELLFEYGSLDHTATGDSNTGALSLAVGYRLLL